MNENQRRLAEVAKTADAPLVIALAAGISVILKQRHDPDIDAQIEAEAARYREQFADRDMERAIAELQSARSGALAAGYEGTARDYDRAVAFIREHWMRGDKP